MGRDEASILDALIFAKQILEFTAGMDEETFISYQLSVINYQFSLH
jgi:uncharacterized protein with HEPN domain